MEEKLRGVRTPRTFFFLFNVDKCLYLEQDPCDMLRKAFHTRDIRTFLENIFPQEWQSVAARIIESGVVISEDMQPWGPRMSPVSPTVKKGKNELETMAKSCLYRAHDCIHQLWGLPLPSPEFTSEEFRTYKKAQMCGEVAVLTLTEFVLAEHMLSYMPELEDLMDRRNAIPMKRGPLNGRSVEQIAARLDGLLHKKIRPGWVRDNLYATRFYDDYVPMLQWDRNNIDHNWVIMKRTGWRPLDAPNVRYSTELDGLELTMWMVKDFFHQCDTGLEVDEGLVEFNRERRARVHLPEGWNGSALL